MSRRTALLTIAAAVLVAAFLRLWQLDAMPPGFYHDEAYNGLDALSLNEGRTFPQYYEGWELYRFEAHGERGPLETRFPIFFEGNYGREPVHVYLMAISTALFGNEVWAVRLVPALGGVLAVVTTAFAAWHIAPDERRWAVAAYAAFACAILFPAVHFSRFGLRAMLFVPVETLCVGLFWVGIRRVTQRYTEGEESYTERRKERAAFVTAGVLLGGGLYVYAAARMLPLVFVGFCAWFLWRYEEQRAAVFRHFALTAGVAFLVALPMLVYFWAYPYFLFFRSGYVATHGKGVVEGQPVLTAMLNFGRILRGFVWQGETHLRHNLPGRPYLDAIQLIFAIIGLLSIFRWRSDRRLFLLLWFFVMLLPSVLSGDAPHFGRLTGVVPVVSILIGIGASQIAGRKFHVANRRLIIHTSYLILFFTISAVWTGYDYFGRYANHPQITTDFYLPARQLGEWAAELPADADIYLTPTREELATILFALGDQRDGFRNYQGSGGIVLFGDSVTPTVHLVSADDSAQLVRLEPFTEKLEPISADYTAIFLTPPPFEPVGTLGEKVTVAADVAELGDRRLITLDWRVEQPIDAALTAFVHLVDADGNIIAQVDRPPAGYPTADWKVGEVVRDAFLLDSAECTNCGIITGFYDPITLTRLSAPLTVWEHP